MQTYQKKMRRADMGRQSREDSPLAGGMPSLAEGASRKDLPEAMRTKMENAFGADFSNLNIIESEKVAEGGAKAVTQGNTIAFAPGEFNLYSPTGEALLGHELSHVVSQARGESRGGGLVDNAYLEAKADREGVMAAAGQQVYNGPVTPISNSTPMSVAGPMQCKMIGKTKDEKTFEKKYKEIKKQKDKEYAYAAKRPDDHETTRYEIEADRNFDSNYTSLLSGYGNTVTPEFIEKLKRKYG